jgi:predicted transcriptional regulator
MGVISVRLNQEEEKMLKKLAEHFHADKSALIKKSLMELYENMMDMEIIEKFEAKERKGKAAFTTAKDILEAS